MSGKKKALVVGSIRAETEATVSGSDEAKVNEVKDELFSKEQLLCAERFSGRRDILNALLVDGEMCSVLTAERIVEDFMKGQVR